MNRDEETVGRDSCETQFHYVPIRLESIMLQNLLIMLFGISSISVYYAHFMLSEYTLC